MDRRAWVTERRRIHEHRMDQMFAPIYDEEWGREISQSHQHMVEEFLSLLPPQACILDAACGTGKYWPLLLRDGRSVVGVDQSAGMLERARVKFPCVACRKLGLQELPFAGEFDGITCIDAMENVAPEDWMPVLGNFAAALRSGGTLYLTVELAPDDLPAVQEAARHAGLPVVDGEYVTEWYHYYPSLDQVRQCLRDSGFQILRDAIGDEYAHFISRRQ